MPLSKDFVGVVRNAGDIVRLISDYVPLKQAGARLKGLCPFHQEKSPSFSVDPQQQLFYCFGCQTGGDIFKFVQLYEKTDFGGSVEFLARRWGVPIPTSDRPEDRSRQRVLEMNAAAEEYYRGQLHAPGIGRAAREYLGRRGVATAMSERFSLGYAPEGWEALSSHLLRKSFRAEEIVLAGLALPRKTGGHYDRFRDRLIFPIRDVNGRAVAFGGRILGDGEPKYLNSPETPAYTKGDNLYGLDLARDAIRREGFAIVVEGYLDLVALHQAGFENGVASLGTAFTPAHARLLSRYATRIVVSYDGDAAGTSAAVRSLDVLLDRGLEVRVAVLPGGLDPDDYLKREGAAAYDRLVRQAPGYLEFLVAREAASRDLSKVEGKVEAINALLPRLVRIPSAVERAGWAARLADTLRVEDELVLQELRTALRAARPAIRQRVEGEVWAPDLEARMVGILLRDPETRVRARSDWDLSDLTGGPMASIVQTILRLDEEGVEVHGDTVAAGLEGESERDLLVRIALRDEPDGGWEEFFGGLETLRARKLRRDGRALGRAVEEADRNGDTESVDDLLARKMRAMREIDVAFTSRQVGEER